MNELKELRTSEIHILNSYFGLINREESDFVTYAIELDAPQLRPSQFQFQRLHLFQVTFYVNTAVIKE